MLISRFELRQSLLMVHGLQLSPLVSTNITVHHLITVFMYISTFRLQLDDDNYGGSIAIIYLPVWKMYF